MKLRKTEYIDQMQNMINTFVDKGAAYPAAMVMSILK
jgi:cysteinyl-tRNA synthetase